jgi:hypothetical protein
MEPEGYHHQQQQFLAVEQANRTLGIFRKQNCLLEMWEPWIEGTFTSVPAR